MDRRLALFDIDKTMIEGISFLPMLEVQAKEGLIDTSVSTSAQQLDSMYHAGSIGYEDYVKGLLDVYAAGLTGRPVEEVSESTMAFFKSRTDFFDYVKPTIELLKPSHDIALVTSNTQFAARAVADLYGITAFRSTELATQDNRFTGSVRSYLATSQQKGGAIKPLLESHRHGESMAFGDSEGDFALLNAVDIPVCIRPTGGLKKVAENRDWIIVESTRDLSSQLGLTAVRQALIYTGVIHERNERGPIDRRYYSEQYQTAANVRARFAMYDLEVCKPGEHPFDPDIEVVKAMHRLGVPATASLLDIGAADAQLQELENLVGLDKGLNVASDPNPVLKVRYKIEKRRALHKIIENRQKLLELMVFSKAPIELDDAVESEDTVSANNKFSVQSDANNIPFKDWSFDVVTALNVLYHSEDVESALAAINRARKNGGYLFVSTSGAGNKPEQRDDELTINHIIEDLTGNSSKEPAKMNDGFTTEKAKNMLTKQFNFVYVLNHEGELLVKDEFSKDIYRGSLLSMYDQYDPLPDWDLFVRAVDQIIDQIPDEGKLIHVSRSVFACGDAPFDPGSGYERVYAETA